MFTTIMFIFQVTVEINNIPSRCLGDCTFQWSSDGAPYLSNISPTSGPSGTTLTLAGSNLRGPGGNVTVRIGGVRCEVIAATDAEIQCTAGEGKASWLGSLCIGHTPAYIPFPVTSRPITIH